MGIQVLVLARDREPAVETADDVASVEGFEASVARDPDAATEHLETEPTDCLVIVPGPTGDRSGEFLAAAGSLVSSVASILLADDAEFLATDLAGAVDGVCRRDDGGEFLAATVENAVDHRGTRTERDCLRRVVENVPVGLFEIDGAGEVAVAAGRATSVLGLIREGDRADEAFEDRPALADAYERAREGEATTVTVDCEEASYDVRFDPLDDPVECVVGAAVDVTERRERERDLELYRTVVEAAGDSMYALDPDGYITMVNESHSELSGISKEELLGSHVSEFMRPEDVEKGTEIILEILNDPDMERGRFEFRGEGLYPGDRERFFEDILAVIEDDGEYAGSVGVIRDITERKHNERELQRQNERLEEFTGVVAHDLRTPLSVVRALVEEASDRHDDPDLAEALSEVDRTQRLIDELLTLARKGETVEDPEPVSFPDVIREAWPDPEAAALTVADPPSTVVADRSRLRELLENLFRNAVEHAGPEDAEGTPPETLRERRGPVSVEVGSIDGVDGFYVADDGPGIPEEHREAVFGHGFTTRKDGTGFGLAIVEQIAGGHGWTIEVTESEDGGARFEVVGLERQAVEPRA